MAARAIATLHAAGCSHRDLNLSNLLLTRERVWLLDLDGAQLRPGIRLCRRSDNLLRLYRSMAKETGRPEPLSLRERWIFLKAYSQGHPELGRTLWRYLRGRWALAQARRSISRLFRRVLTG